MENGRVALVSGANRGIGRETVRQLTERGIMTILGSRDEEKGRAAAEGMEGDVRVQQLDVTDEKDIQNLACDVEEEFGRLDVLVNNAGVSMDGGQRGVDADLDVVGETLEMNLFAWRLCEAFVPLMQRNRYGRIVNISSGMGAINDMGGSGASRAIEAGADTQVWAATLPNNGPTGGFFRDRRQIPW
jgi:NAD(P)-dependent dehydrogenase (short-subunit alcohol dehydrogenase family)